MQQHQALAYSQKKPFKTYQVTIHRVNEENIVVELFAKNPGELHQFLSDYWSKNLQYTFVEASEDIA